MIRTFKRLRTAKGYGVHSPFAFYFITKILREKLPYSAFFDVEKLLKGKGVESNFPLEKYHLFFRIAHFFKSENILQIGTDDGADALYLASVGSMPYYACVSDNQKQKELHEKLRWIHRNANIFDTFRDIPTQTYDLICWKLKNDENISIQNLLDVSNERMCWIIHPLDASAENKKIWEDIKKHPQVRVTFDKKGVGVVILNPDYHKKNYKV